MRTTRAFGVIVRIPSRCWANAASRREASDTSSTRIRMRYTRCILPCVALMLYWVRLSYLRSCPCLSKRYRAVLSASCADVLKVSICQYRWDRLPWVYRRYRGLYSGERAWVRTWRVASGTIRVVSNTIEWMAIVPVVQSAGRQLHTSPRCDIELTARR